MITPEVVAAIAGTLGTIAVAIIGAVSAASTLGNSTSGRVRRLTALLETSTPPNADTSSKKGARVKASVSTPVDHLIEGLAVEVEVHNRLRYEPSQTWPPFCLGIGVGLILAGAAIVFGFTIVPFDWIWLGQAAAIVGALTSVISLVIYQSKKIRRYKAQRDAVRSMWGLQPIVEPDSQRRRTLRKPKTA